MTSLNCLHMIRELLAVIFTGLVMTQVWGVVRARFIATRCMSMKCSRRSSPQRTEKANSVAKTVARHCQDISDFPLAGAHPFNHSILSPSNVASYSRITPNNPILTVSSLTNHRHSSIAFNRPFTNSYFISASKRPVPASNLFESPLFFICDLECMYLIE